MMLEGSVAESLSQNSKTCRNPHIYEYTVPQEKDNSRI